MPRAVVVTVRGRGDASERLGRVGVAVLVVALLAACGSRPLHSPRAASSLAAQPLAPPATSGSAPAPTGPTAAPAPAPALVWTGCGASVQCAALDVPLDYAHPEGAKVHLALVRHRATDRAHRIGSLVVNPGGPGESGVSFLPGFLDQIPASVLARFDIVSFDPRGVGSSDPVRCLTDRQLDAAYDADPVPTPANRTALLALAREQADACAQHAGGLLAHVSTADVARDLDRIRAAVGDDRLTYLGYSYGTSLGAAYAEQFPTRVRALVLDGAVDPTLTGTDFLRAQGEGFERAFDGFLAWCAAAASCAWHTAAGPAPTQVMLGRAFDELADRLRAAPLAVGGRHLGAGELFYGVALTLYLDTARQRALLGAGLAAASRGDGSALLHDADLYTERTDGHYSNSTDANVAVSCTDRPWPRDPAAYDAAARAAAPTAPRFGPLIAYSGAVCAYWPVPATGTAHPVHAPGAPPVLVVGTTRDPATPYPWAQALAAQLDAGELLTWQGDGHTAYRSTGSMCVQRAVDDYLLRLTPPAAGTVCS